MHEFVMPSMGADMDSGTLLEWKVAPGDVVHKGDIVAVVDTDKSAIDVEAFHDGVVAELLADVGSTVPVGTTLALFGDGDDEVPDTAARTVSSEEPMQVQGSPPASAATARRVMSHPIGGNAGPVVSPLVRRLARARDVDTSLLVGSGPGGVVTRHDVEQACRARSMPTARPRVTPRARRLARERGVDLTRLVVPEAGTRAAITGDDILAAGSPSSGRSLAGTVTPAGPEDRQASMRRAIAAAMSRSAREIPHYHLADTVDLQPALTWLQRVNANRATKERIMPAALLYAAAARAAAAVPEMNGTYERDRFRPASSVDLGVVVALRNGGLMAPVIRSADTLTLDQLMARLREVIVRSRRGGLRSSEMTGGSITVTNLGDQGAAVVHGLIYPPQVALVGFGRITDEGVVVNGELAVHPTTVLTLAADHRVSDGLHGGRFVRVIKTILDSPEDQL